jgi:hypothetical protein
MSYALFSGGLSNDLREPENELTTNIENFKVIYQSQQQQIIDLQNANNTQLIIIQELTEKILKIQELIDSINA